MKFMRNTAGYSLLDHRRKKKDTLEEIIIDQVEKKLSQKRKFSSSQQDGARKVHKTTLLSTYRKKTWTNIKQIY
jgi:hypothetical protein